MPDRTRLEPPVQPSPAARLSAPEPPALGDRTASFPPWAGRPPAPKWAPADGSVGRMIRPAAGRPWEVARWGRLLAGLSVLFFTTLGLLAHPGWLLGTLAVALNLVTTSIIYRCILRALLLGLGAREREDLFLPGGGLRAEAAAPALRERPGSDSRAEAAAGPGTRSGRAVPARQLHRAI